MLVLFKGAGYLQDRLLFTPDNSLAEFNELGSNLQTRSIGVGFHGIIPTAWFFRFNPLHQKAWLLRYIKITWINLIQNRVVPLPIQLFLPSCPSQNTCVTMLCRIKVNVHPCIVDSLFSIESTDFFSAISWTYLYVEEPSLIRSHLALFHQTKAAPRPFGCLSTMASEAGRTSCPSRANPR